MKGKQKAVAVAVAAVLACGALAGCDDLTTINTQKNYAQTVAEINLMQSEQFSESTGDFYDVRDVVETTSILKRDMIMSYLASGYSLQNSYGWSYRDTFNMILDSLINRQVYVQYAKAYLMKYGDDGDEATESNYSLEDYKTYVSGDLTDIQRTTKSLEYFLTAEEKAKAEYDLKVSVNSTIDSLEEEIIVAEEDEHNHTADSSVRTTPTGANTEDSDYYDNQYKIYTGKDAELEGNNYEKVEGSNPTTRRKAYVRYLSNLRSNDLINKGEDTSNFMSLEYYTLQLRSAYESAIINKMSDIYELLAEKNVTVDWAQSQFEDYLTTHINSYGKDKSTFETAFDGISDSSFVLAAPMTEGSYDKYGYVINILLPFSTTQSVALGELSKDYGDDQGNSFAARAQLLKAIRATDQRSTWFTGHDDYSFLATEEDDAFTNNNSKRGYLFFENNLKKSSDVTDSEGNVTETAQYEKLANYYGKYTYNGTVKATKDGDHTDYKFTPNRIDIDGFLAEMTGYLKSATYGEEGKKLTLDNEKSYSATYYTETNYYFTDKTEDHDIGDIDYSKFIYASGKVVGDGAYNPNHIFLEGSWENTAMSVINELSFAYNTDTAGLNTYLGYSVSPYKTSYMTEFEYAAQKAVEDGAGSYYVVPTDYGWHIIYCTFSFVDMANGYVGEDGKTSPFKFDESEMAVEGTFSYLWYEYLKSTAVSTFASNMQTDAINVYADTCSTKYENRYSDLLNMD